jgi:hypothetical protein
MHPLSFQVKRFMWMEGLMLGLAYNDFIK